jgi:hypothetical protein
MIGWIRKEKEEEEEKKIDELCYISRCPGHNRRKILAQSDSGQCSKIKAYVGRSPMEMME